jgi:tetratricopeptide (TPR) repeat protein
MLRGRIAEAVATLEPAITSETAPSQRGRLTRMLAEALLAQGRTVDALRVADAALAGQPEFGTRYTAGRIFIAAKHFPRALAIAKQLRDSLTQESQSLARVLQAETALALNQPREALTLLEEARQFADGWLLRYAMGRAYLAIDAFIEADSALDACIQRRGEASAVFLDDIPSYRMLAPVYYHQGLARAGLRSASAAESFKTFLAFKAGGDEQSALLSDARSRLP